ncbi:MAG: sodium/proline symporter [Planctomycetota bacterium]
MNLVLLGFLVYLILILCVGMLTSRLIRSQADFILGGRRLGPWVIAFSERASGESAWLIVGLPGAALAVGFVEIWTVIGCTSGILFSWFVIAKKLRLECDRFNDLTLPDFFMNRFPEATSLLRLCASLLITFFFTFYVAAQILAAGKVLDATFPEILAGIQEFLLKHGDIISLDWETKTIGMIIGSIIIIFYTVMGGFLAVAWTDLFQGIIMIFTLVVLPVALFFELSNQVDLQQMLNSLDMSILSVTGGKTGVAVWLAVLGGLSWGFGYMGQPHLLSRFKAIRSHKDIRKGALIATFWAVPAFWGAFLIGFFGLCLYGAETFEDPETLMPTVTLAIMPAWLAGIMISGAVAAMMSTADSQLLVTSSTLSEDLFHKFLHRNASQKTLVLCSRAITLAIGIFAYYLAVKSTDLVYEMVAYAWSGLSASFGPPLLLALWWKRTNGYGVLAGMVTGAMTVIIWTTAWFSKLYIWLFFSPEVYEKVELFLNAHPDAPGSVGIDPASLMISHRISGFTVSFGLVVLVSLLTKKGKQDAAPTV